MNEAPWKLPWIGLVYILVVLLVFPNTAITTDAPTTPQTATSDATNKNKIIEQSLLKMFGFKKRPRLKEGTVIPEHLLQLYEAKVKDTSESTDFAHNRRLLIGSANTIRSFYHIENDDDRTRDANTIRLRFDLDDVPVTERLAGAELRLYKEWLIDANDRLYRVDIHDIVKAGKTPEETISHLIDTKIIDTRQKDAWESFDISATVLRWLKSERRHNQIEVRFLSLEGRKTDNQHLRLRRSVPEEGKKKKKRKRKKKSDENWDQNRPHLVTYSDDSKAQTKSERKEERKRRRMERRRRRRKWKDQCRRHKLYVDFSDVGWNDWIVAPPGYHAYYCHGECPMPLADHLNSTNHAIVQNLVNSAYPEAVPKACCVPTELSPISMLYADETGAVVLKTYQEMVVQGCGCR